MSDNFEFGKKKKKKVTTSTKKEDDTAAAPTKEEETSNEPEQEQTVTAVVTEETSSSTVEEKKAAEDFKPAGNDYTYEELAKRIFNLVNSARPEEKTVYKMKPPVVYRDGNVRTVWANFVEICKIMDRPEEHVQSFVLAEVGSTGSLDGSRRLVVKGKFQPKHVENILRNYIAEYVKCHTCKSPETHLRKENRLTFMVCSKCGSSRSVAAIKSGFQVTTRAARREARDK